MTILVTGANGRLGRAIVDSLSTGGKTVTAAARQFPLGLPQGVAGFAVGDIDENTDWSAALKRAKVVVHCSALTWREHTDPEDAFARVNVAGTERLARQAVAAGVNRFIFISSLTVNGKHSDARPFRHDDPPNPQSDYSRSKWEAELVLNRISAETGLQIIILRPPRIVWPQLNGNLAALEKLVRKGVPLPFGLLDTNARENLSAELLVSVVSASIAMPDRENQVFLVSDGKPLSTRELILWLGRRARRQPLLLPAPSAMLELLLGVIPQRLLGKLNRAEMFDELTRNLVVDPVEIERVNALIAKKLPTMTFKI